MNDSQDIRTERKPKCHLCDSEGKYIYENLEDRIFGAPGHWNIRKCRNPACGLLWLDPMPARSDLVKLYSNYYTHTIDFPKDSLWKKLAQKMYEGYWSRRYGYLEPDKSWLDKMLGSFIYLHPGRRAELDVYPRFLPDHVDGKLLEIGCGNGGKLVYLKKSGWDVEGVDFDYAAVENARRKGLNVRLGELEEQLYPENSYDAIVSSHVLEHVPEPIKLLRECHRLLKPGGQIVFATPNAGSYGHKVFKAHWRGLEPPRHLHIFNRDSLRHAAEIAGFQHSQCHATGRGGFALFASLMLKRYGAFNSQNLTWWNRLERHILYYAEWMIVTINERLGEDIMLNAMK